MQVIVTKVPNESGYMICFTGVTHFLLFSLHALALLRFDCFWCLNPHVQMGVLLPPPFFFYSIDIVYVFIQWLYLKLLNFSFRSSSASLWIPERKQGWAASLRNTLLVFNTFFPECLPCDSIRNSPAFSWKTISYFLAFLCQCYPGLWLMLTSVIFCDFPPKLSISTQATEQCSPIHSNYERDIWDSWKRVLRIKKWDGKQQSLLSQMHSRSQLRLSSKLPLKSLRILLACPMLWSLFFIY